MNEQTHSKGIPRLRFAPLGMTVLSCGEYGFVGALRATPLQTPLPFARLSSFRSKHTQCAQSRNPFATRGVSNANNV